MLFFRSEEHIDRWCHTWHLPHGATMTLAKAWDLATAWYSEDRRQPSWRRRTLEETETVFAELGFTGDFWSLR
jgi:hypothetical protein